MLRSNERTRMVQLTATAAIEYVAAGHFFPGGLLAGGIFVREGFCPGVYARSPQVQCVYEPSRLSVPNMIYDYPAGGRIQLTIDDKNIDFRIKT